MSPHDLELLFTGGLVLLTGAVGWWAKYVTTGAQKAHRLADQMAELKASVIHHEEREEVEFGHLRDGQSDMRDVQSEIARQIGEIHGKVDTLMKVLVDKERDNARE